MSETWKTTEIRTARYTYDRVRAIAITFVSSEGRKHGVGCRTSEFLLATDSPHETMHMLRKLADLIEEKFNPDGTLKTGEPDVEQN